MECKLDHLARSCSTVRGANYNVPKSLLNLVTRRKRESRRAYYSRMCQILSQYFTTKFAADFGRSPKVQRCIQGVVGKCLKPEPAAQSGGEGGAGPSFSVSAAQIAGIESAIYEALLGLKDRAMAEPQSAAEADRAEARPEEDPDAARAKSAGTTQSTTSSTANRAIDGIGEWRVIDTHCQLLDLDAISSEKRRARQRIADAKNGLDDQMRQMQRSAADQLDRSSAYDERMAADQAKALAMGKELARHRHERLRSLMNSQRVAAEEQSRSRREAAEAERQREIEHLRCVHQELEEEQREERTALERLRRDEQARRRLEAAEHQRLLEEERQRGLNEDRDMLAQYTAKLDAEEAARKQEKERIAKRHQIFHDIAATGVYREMKEREDRLDCLIEDYQRAKAAEDEAREQRDRAARREAVAAQRRSNAEIIRQKARAKAQEAANDEAYAVLCRSLAAAARDEAAADERARRAKLLHQRDALELQMQDNQHRAGQDDLDPINRAFYKAIRSDKAAVSKLHTTLVVEAAPVQRRSKTSRVIG